MRHSDSPRTRCATQWNSSGLCTRAPSNAAAAWCDTLTMTSVIKCRGWKGSAGQVSQDSCTWTPTAAGHRGASYAQRAAAAELLASARLRECALAPGSRAMQSKMTATAPALAHAMHAHNSNVGGAARAAAIAFAAWCVRMVVPRASWRVPPSAAAKARTLHVFSRRWHGTIEQARERGIRIRLQLRTKLTPLPRGCTDAGDRAESEAKEDRAEECEVAALAAEAPPRGKGRHPGAGTDASAAHKPPRRSISPCRRPQA